ncbi:MAG: hypothetical protein MR935_00815, partial [Agathobaculum sp.]|uniref:hypothetical protein n=1 Tax=Agathobaculum sp. TaxID=2048138 RepID=UPI0025C412D3
PPDKIKSLQNKIHNLFIIGQFDKTAHSCARIAAAMQPKHGQGVRCRPPDRQKNNKKMRKCFTKTPSRGIMYVLSPCA